jgi:hypothetical protein
MTKTQERRYNMFGAVWHFCKAQPALLDLNLPFKRGVLKLEAALAAIDAAIAGQSVSPESAGAEKKLTRANLCNAAAVACAQLAAWAAEQNDVGLQARTKWTVSSLERLSDKNLENAARAIATDARAALARDPQLGLDPAEVLQLESLIGQFVEKKPILRNTTSQRSRQTATLSQLMTRTGALLKDQLDKAVIKYKVTHPEFYREYKENRKVMDVAGREEKKAVQ